MKNLIQFIIVLAVIALLCGLPTLLMPQAGFPVIFPHVQLPGEQLTEIGGFSFTNTFAMTLIADVILLIIAVIAGSMARRRLKQYEANPNTVDTSGDDMMVPKGWLNTFEAILEFMYDLAEQVVGSKWANRVFPLATTIFLLVLVSNWLHFLPVIDAVGIMHCAEEKGYEAVEIGNTGIFRLDIKQAMPAGEPSGVECPHHAEGEAGAHSAEGEGAEEVEGDGVPRYVVTPFLRTATTDLNLTLAIAIVAMISVQYFGVRELGLGYFSKFFNLPALSKGAMGWIDLLVSWLEAISEFAKVIAFSLRLFGNIFAGAILLFVITFLIPVGGPLVFDLLEVLIGALQAFVFAMLTLVFVSVAQVGHGDHEDEHH